MRLTIEKSNSRVRRTAVARTMDGNLKSPTKETSHGSFREISVLLHVGLIHIVRVPQTSLLVLYKSACVFYEPTGCAAGGSETEFLRVAIESPLSPRPRRTRW